MTGRNGWNGNKYVNIKQMDGSIGGDSDNRLAVLQAEVDLLRGKVKDLSAALSAARGGALSWCGVASRLPGSAYLLDGAGGMTFVAGGALAGVKAAAPATVAVDDWSALIDPEDRPLYHAFCLRSGSETCAVEYRLSTDSGPRRLLDMRFPPGSEKAEAGPVCGFMLDVSSAQSAGALRSCCPVPGTGKVSVELTGMVIHDLKNPLALISMAAESFASGAFGELSESQSRYIALIRISAARQLMLVMNLLEIDRLEDGQHPVSLGEMEVAEILEEKHWVLDYARLEGKKLELSFPSPLRLCADKALLSRALSNLLANAIKRTPARGSVSVKAAAAGEEVVLTVSDQGESVDARYLRDIFERDFMAGGGARAAAGLNTGLGLTFCKLAVAACGGRIWAENTAGGTVLCIALRQACPA